MFEQVFYLYLLITFRAYFDYEKPILGKMSPDFFKISHKDKKCKSIQTYSPNFLIVIRLQN